MTKKQMKKTKGGLAVGVGVGKKPIAKALMD